MKKDDSIEKTIRQYFHNQIMMSAYLRGFEKGIKQQKAMIKEQDEKWINYKDWVPDAEIPIIVNVKISFKGEDELFMIRKVKVCGLTGVIRYTDCTHPMQQGVCFPDWIIGWKFQREEDMLNLRMRKNTWSRQIEADRIISNIEVSKKDEVLHKINSNKRRLVGVIKRFFK